MGYTVAVVCEKQNNHNKVQPEVDLKWRYKQVLFQTFVVSIFFNVKGFHQFSLVLLAPTTFFDWNHAIKKYLMKQNTVAANKRCA